ncbi:unnamed protein product [Adineta ricciae]|uniref:Uncharacterized protein n=1 Tax=Adineta ricciae TaxID=249248 RepID=A0A816BFZ7_ADIRI|nr:unnamed protein product [Adineta ricciae]
MMEDENNQRIDGSSTTTKIKIVRRIQSRIIIGVALITMIILVIIIPITITLTKQTHMTTITSIETTSLPIITTDNIVMTTKTTNTITTTRLVTTATSGDSTPSLSSGSIGTYWSTEPSENALDGNISTEYTNHGICNSESPLSFQCGLNTGLYLTLEVKQATLIGFQIGTNKGWSYRDPLTITIEGSNSNKSELTLGKSWILIYNGTTGLTIDPGREKYGILQTVYYPQTSFRSYRILITSIRGESTSVSYSEFQMLGFFQYN